MKSTDFVKAYVETYPYMFSYEKRKELLDMNEEEADAYLANLNQIEFEELEVQAHEQEELAEDEPEIEDFELNEVRFSSTRFER